MRAGTSISGEFEFQNTSQKINPLDTQYAPDRAHQPDPGYAEKLSALERTLC